LSPGADVYKAKLEAEARWAGLSHSVEYRLGGRESQTRYGGSFKRKEDALKRKRWLDGELAATRVPTFVR
jgi:hypothetical protein